MLKFHFCLTRARGRHKMHLLFCHIYCHYVLVNIFGAHTFLNAHYTRSQITTHHSSTIVLVVVAIRMCAIVPSEISFILR